MTKQSSKGVLARLVYGTSLKRTTIRLILVIGVCLVVFKVLFIPVRVDGGSMSPTYSDRGLNFICRMAYRRAEPRRGDVVAVRTRESSRSVVLMKRVVGLPGEAIGFREGRVIVNGQPLDEPYVRFDSDWNHEPVICGPDEYYVVGDNRSMPMQDHTQGRVKRRLIAGKILL